MKPNWKKFAKQAFERGRMSGYEAGCRDSQERTVLESEWRPKNDPPKESGVYMCRMIKEQNGRIVNILETVQYSLRSGFENPWGYIITHWLKAPEPPMVYITTRNDETVAE